MDSVKTQDSPYLAENQILHIAVRRVLSRLALTWPSAPTVNSKSSVWSCGNHERTKVFINSDQWTEGLGVLMEQPIRAVVYVYFLILKKKSFVCLFPGVEYLMKT